MEILDPRRQFIGFLAYGLVFFVFGVLQTEFSCGVPALKREHEGGDPWGWKETFLGAASAGCSVQVMWYRAVHLKPGCFY